MNGDGKLLINIFYTLSTAFIPITFSDYIHLLFKFTSVAKWVNHLIKNKGSYLCLCVAATHLPVVQLNFAAVSQETPFSRDVVGGCIRETLLLLSKALASEQILLLSLQGIGVLHFRNNKVAFLLTVIFHIYDTLLLCLTATFCFCFQRCAWCSAKIS